MQRETTPLSLKKQGETQKICCCRKIQLILRYTNKESLILAKLSLFKTTFLLIKLGYYLTFTKSSKNKKTMNIKHISMILGTIKQAD